MKFNLIGCGRISANHFRAIKEIENAEITACTDTVEEKAQEAAKKYDIPAYYTNYKEMLDIEQPDAAIICTPSGLHTEHGVQAAQRGIHVITEKPMAILLEDADTLVKACDENEVRLFVVKQNRLNTTMQLLKKAIDKNRFGRIYMVQSNVFWQRPQSYYDMAKWRGTWEFDGGAFMNQASHYIDALHWLIGEVDHVLAETATLARRVETEDTGSAILRFRNGVIGSINVTMLTYPKNFEGSITVIGEKGTVKIGGIAVNKIDKWEFAEYDDDDRIITDSNYQPPDVYGFGHLPYYKNVISTLLGEAEPNTDGRDGRKSLEIILAIYLAAKTGKKVALPLDR
ncbi:MAG: Gfo/Idh/MocA family oxidoreductase [Candidatus Cloacimonetes bacterium]|nr:Gfo/Idh/MocA family oxidoreductase [Candidatus Cloacimonadota bacterium]